MATQLITHDNTARQRQRQGCASTSALSREFSAARSAQRRWQRIGLRQRLRVIRKIRDQIAQRADVLVESVQYPHRRDPAETLAAEVIPLADACKFIELEAARVLAPRRLKRRSRPLWLGGVSVEVRREPFGVILIVGAANYPLFLPGVQAIQALTAGNAVFIKPGVGAGETTQVLVETLVRAGVDSSLLQCLPEASPWVAASVNAGADKVVLTGSADTGRSVQTLLANSLTPATMELSGCDSVFVLQTADLERVTRCLSFGLRFNGSATCIAPRRVFVPASLKNELENRLIRALQHDVASAADDRIERLVSDAIRAGARPILGGVSDDGIGMPTVLTDAQPQMRLLQSDIFAPILSLVPVDSISAALRANAECPYALGASVFGAEHEARQLATSIHAGCVVINDIIAPTADPRVPFGGRGQSGFGVTRGAAGLEAMTQVKAIVNQRGRWLPHLDETSPFDARLLKGFLGMVHGRGWQARLRSAWGMAQAATDQRRWKQEQRRNCGD